MNNFESKKSSNESIGIVPLVGAKVKDHAPGDKVIYLERGHCNTFLRSPANKCIKLDKDADLITIATFGLSHRTALYSLQYLTRNQANETSLI